MGRKNILLGGLMETSLKNESLEWLMQRNDELIDQIHLHETHPNASNRRNNDALLVELRDNLVLSEALSERVLGKDNKKGKKGKKGKEDKKKKGKKGKEDKKKKDKKDKKKKNKKGPTPFFGHFGIPLGIMTDSY